MFLLKNLKDADTLRFFLTGDYPWWLLTITWVTSGYWMFHTKFGIRYVEYAIHPDFFFVLLFLQIYNFTAFFIYRLTVLVIMCISCRDTQLHCRLFCYLTKFCLYVTARRTQVLTYNYEVCCIFSLFYINGNVNYIHYFGNVGFISLRLWVTKPFFDLHFHWFPIQSWVKQYSEKEKFDQG